jgi:hypothetical protein
MSRPHRQPVHIERLLHELAAEQQEQRVMLTAILQRLQRGRGPRDETDAALLVAVHWRGHRRGSRMVLVHNLDDRGDLHRGRREHFFLREYGLVPRQEFERFQLNDGAGQGCEQ